MLADISYPHIERLPNAVARLARLPRIRVAQIVMDHLAHGWSVEEMCRQHPYLLPAEAHSAMAYYFDHREEIHTEIDAEMQDNDAARRDSAPPPVVARLRMLRGA